MIIAKALDDVKRLAGGRADPVEFWLERIQKTGHELE